MNRRLSSSKFAHRLRDLPDPTDNTRVVTLWEGIRRTHGEPPEQAPLMPPELCDVLEARPAERQIMTRGRGVEADLAGLRDRGLLLVGFVAALRRSELADLQLRDVGHHPNGLVVTLPRSRPISVVRPPSWWSSPAPAPPRAAAVTTPALVSLERITPWR